jgi:hypothetical protein
LKDWRFWISFISTTRRKGCGKIQNDEHMSSKYFCESLKILADDNVLNWLLCNETQAIPGRKGLGEKWIAIQEPVGRVIISFIPKALDLEGIFCMLHITCS